MSTTHRTRKARARGHRGPVTAQNARRSDSAPRHSRWVWLLIPILALIISAAVAGRSLTAWVSYTASWWINLCVKAILRTLGPFNISLTVELLGTLLAVLGSCWIYRRGLRAGWTVSGLRKCIPARGWHPAGVALVGVFCCGFVSVLAGWPQPRVHDEFGYALIGETFAEGRLTNPSHPLSDHFESPYVLQRPSRIAKFPPGQGVMLALGTWLTGKAIVGVWLSVAFSAGAICWMLQAWISPRWATVGGILAAIRFGCWGCHNEFYTDQAAIHAGYWGQSLWGGALAAAGGALLLGASVRLYRRPRSIDGLLLGLGLAILANTRPFEGLLLAITVALSAVVALYRKRLVFSPALMRAGISATAVVLVTGVAMGCYHQQTTGSPWRMPYQEYLAQYQQSTQFLWNSSATEGEVPSTTMEQLNARSRAMQVEQQPPRGFFLLLFYKLRKLGRFFLGAALVVPFVAGVRLKTARWTRFAWLSLAVVGVGVLSETYCFPHYLAPVAPVIIYFIVQGLRSWMLSRPAREVASSPRQFLASALVGVACLCVLTAGISRSSISQDAWHLQRADIVRQLQQTAEQDLVLVRYGPGHSVDEEWVHNAADIDSSDVVWARSLSARQNRQLLDYYPSRNAWLWEPDTLPLKLQPLRDSTELNVSPQ